MIPVYQTGAAASEFAQINNLEELEKLRKSTTDKCVALLFWAEWHEPCHHLKDMMNEMAKVHSHIKFSWVSSLLKLYLIIKYSAIQTWLKILLTSTTSIKSHLFC